MKRYLITILVFALVLGANAQELRDYFLACDPEEFAYLLQHPEENQPVVCAVEYEGQTWEDATLSLRPGPYLQETKKSFVLDFSPEDPFLERDEMILSAQWNDPTFSREYLAYDLFRRAGLPAPECWFVRLYVNGDYMGLYLDLEVLDERFLLRAGLPQESSIYRAEEPGCLLRYEEPFQDLWVKVTYAETGYYDLANLALWLETVHDEYFFDQLWERFSQEELPRFIAVNALIGNRSTYYDHYALEHDLNPGGIWRLLPWEADSCFVYADDYEEPDYFRCGNPLLSDTNVLINRCFRRDDTRSLIADQIQNLSDSLFTEEYYQALTDSLASLLLDAVTQDTAKPFTVDDFLNGLAAIPGDVSGRRAALSEQLDHQPLPFDLNPALLTPGGVYFSWDQTRIADGSPVGYVIEIASDAGFTQDVVSLDAGAATSFIYSDISAGNYFWRVQAVSPAQDSVRSLTYFSTFNVPEDAFSGTIWRDPVTEDVTWTRSQSPISLPDGLIISPGATLTIEPGVLVGIGTGKTIFIQGGLTAVGTAEDSIHFVPLNPDSSWGAFYAESPTGEVTFAFNSIMGGSNIDSGQGTPAALKIGYGVLNIFDTSFRLCEHAALTAAYTDVHLERVIFDYFPIRPVIVLAGSAVVRSCRFSHSSPLMGSGLLEINAVDAPSEVSGSEFYGCYDDALDFDDTHAPVLISRNIIWGASDKGISIGDQCSDITVSNCVITDCGIGMGIYSNANVTLFNNVIAGNDDGLKLSVHGNTGLTTVRNSVIWNNQTDVIAPFGTNLTMEYTLIGGVAPYPGAGNLAGDPQFTDAANDNFFPAEGSPLIDAGYGNGAPDQDLIFSDRFDVPDVANTGAGTPDYVDIGVFEFRPELYPGVKTDPVDAEEFILLDNFPNPFNSTTCITFNLPVGGWAELSIYNLLGREVFRRRFDNLLPGNHSLIWDGGSKDGSRVASGIYLYRLQTRVGTCTSKMILLK